MARLRRELKSQGKQFDLSAVFQEALAVAQLNCFRVVIDRASIWPCGLVDRVRHHALRKQRGERLFHVDHADMAERAGPETGVEQMQNRVLDTMSVRSKPNYRKK